MDIVKETDHVQVFEDNNLQALIDSHKVENHKIAKERLISLIQRTIEDRYIKPCSAEIVLLLQRKGVKALSEIIDIVPQVGIQVMGLNRASPSQLLALYKQIRTSPTDVEIKPEDEARAIAEAKATEFVESMDASIVKDLLTTVQPKGS